MGMSGTPSYSILYIGDLWRGSTALHRMEALRENGHWVTAIDTYPDALKAKDKRLYVRGIWKLFGPIDWVHANRALEAAFQKNRFDVLWIDKGLSIRPEVLAEIKDRHPECRIAGYSPDDMYNPANQSRRFLRGLRYYDIYFTTKSYGVEELRSLGCRRVEFIGNAFEPSVHRPMAVTAEDRERLGGAVGFIGQWEKERGESICYLASRGIEVRVWGYSWEHCRGRPAGLRLENRPVWGEEYAKALCAFDINLCFLRKGNRDLQTTRSIEIPACGGFMLAERTEEHQDLFEEGKEAEFFSRDEELADKVQYYLSHEEERIRIARAGRERCLRSGYSNAERLRRALVKVFE